VDRGEGVMHPSALKAAEDFTNKYLDPDKQLTVLDVGSFNVNGCLKPLFLHNGYYCVRCGNVTRDEGLNDVICDCVVGAPPVRMELGLVCDGIRVRKHNIRRVGKAWVYIGMDTYESCAPYGDMRSRGNLGKNVDVIAQDPHAFPFSDGSFDVVLSTSCLEHDPAFWVTFSEMVRVVKPQGLIYTDAPSNGPYHGYPLDCWRFQKDAYLALARWSGRVELLEQYICDDVSLHGGWADNIGIFRKA
jgi:SAM-dependent methyltransferase